MTFLPIVERELRVRARLRSTYRFRLFAAMSAIGLVGLMLLASETIVAAGKYGGMLFGALAWVSFAYCLLDGARNTADCLPAPFFLCGGPLLPLIWVIKNMVFVNFAHEQLRRQFRALVTDRFGWAEKSEFVGAPSKRSLKNPLPRVFPG